MSEAKARKFHTAEFKAKVGLYAVRGLKKPNSATRANLRPILAFQFKRITRVLLLRNIV